MEPAIQSYDADATELSALPEDLLGRVCCLTACPQTMAQVAQTCQLLRVCAGEGAMRRGDELGYEEFVDCEEDGTVTPAVATAKTAIHDLYRLHLDPATAKLPPSIPAPAGGSAALSLLRDEFGHFEPRLCARLHLPEEVNQDERNPGVAEYANFAALYRASLSAGDVSTPAIQGWIEAAWSEGMDQEGAAQFGGELVGKTGDAACIGAADIIVALWHLRFNACMIEMIDVPDGEALFKLAEALFSYLPDGTQSVHLPIFVQVEGCSFLIVGVTRAIDRALFVVDPQSPGEVACERVEQIAGGSFQVVVCRGMGPAPAQGPSAKPLSVTLKECGQRDGARSITPAARVRTNLNILANPPISWSLSPDPALRWLKNAMKRPREEIL